VKESEQSVVVAKIATVNMSTTFEKYINAIHHECAVCKSGKCFYGDYTDVRATRDYRVRMRFSASATSCSYRRQQYHRNYTKERQLFQDAIVAKALAQGCVLCARGDTRFTVHDALQYRECATEVNFHWWSYGCWKELRSQKDFSANQRAVGLVCASRSRPNQSVLGMHHEWNATELRSVCLVRRSCLNSRR
jgi:hypothetical protein